MKIKLLVLTIFTTLLTMSCRGTDDQPLQSKAIPVKTETVKMEKISRPVHTSGILTPVSQIKLSFKIGGIINKWYLDEGSNVKDGQLLAELDMSEINARVAQAKSAFDKARRDYERVQNLYADSVATIEQLQNAETGLSVAQADFDVAKFNLRHSAIYAPADGSILRRLAESDEIVAAGQPVYLFGVSGKEWTIRVGVSEVDLLRLSMDDPAEIRFDSYPGKSFPARVTEIAETASPVNGTFEVELSMDKSNDILKSGFIAKVDIYPGKTEEYLTIPIEALVDADEAEGFIFVPDEKREGVKKIQVSIGFVYGDRVAISIPSGLVDAVVTDGSSYIEESSIIKITN